MRIVDQAISLAELREMAEAKFGEAVKAVVDVQRGAMAVGADLHADEESELLARGSEQENLWGINLYPDQEGDAFVEFDSMINIRPREGNRSRGVESAETREAIRRVVERLVQR
ncbi:MAG: DUF5674 family protein [Armatimonadota bacterium]